MRVGDILERSSIKKTYYSRMDVVNQLKAVRSKIKQIEYLLENTGVDIKHYIPELREIQHYINSIPYTLLMQELEGKVQGLEKRSDED